MRYDLQNGQAYDLPYSPDAVLGMAGCIVQQNAHDNREMTVNMEQSGLSRLDIRSYVDRLRGAFCEGGRSGIQVTESGSYPGVEIYASKGGLPDFRDVGRVVLGCALERNDALGQSSAGKIQEKGKAIVHPGAVNRQQVIHQPQAHTKQR